MANKEVSSWRILSAHVKVNLIWQCFACILTKCVIIIFLQADVILVDIDGGHVFFPDAINLASLPEPFLGRTRHELTLVSLQTQVTLRYTVSAGFYRYVLVSMFVGLIHTYLSYKKSENRRKKKAKWATTLKPSMAMLCTCQK